MDDTARFERQNYYGDIYDDFYGEIYDMLTNDPSLSFGDIEARFDDFYGRHNYNKVELESAYDLAHEDILFWLDNEEKETTKILTK